MVLSLPNQMPYVNVQYVKLTLESDDGFIRIAVKANDFKENENKKEDYIVESNDKKSSQNSSSADEESQMLLLRIRSRITSFLSSHYRLLRNLFLLALFVAYMVYYGFAMAYSVSAATALTVLTCLGFCVFVLVWLNDHYGSQMKETTIPMVKSLYKRHWLLIQWSMGTGMLVISMGYIFLFSITTLRQVRSFFGAIFFLLFIYVTSKRPDKVRWLFVGIGLFVQFILGLIVLRWPNGYIALDYLFGKIRHFGLSYPVSGAQAVFGNVAFVLHPVAMYVSSLAVYVACVIPLLYGLARVIRLVRYTKRWLPLTTDSQLHLVLVVGHVFVSGFALTLLAVAGTSIHHYVTGIALCLPAAISISFLSCPETQESKFSFKAQAVRDTRPRQTTNVVLMAYHGCLAGARIAGLLLANVIAFTSIYALFDSVYSWLASRVGIETNLLETLGYAFMPISYLMGVRWEECYVVGCLVADKVFVYVLRALRDLGVKISLHEIQNDSAVIATHAMLGMSVLGTLCAWMALFQAIAPRHRRRMMSMFPRILMNVNVVCFYSASVAVVLSPESEYDTPGTMTGNQLLVLWVLKIIPSYRDLMG